MLTVDFGRLALNPGCRILDVGCGSGRHTAAAFSVFGGLVIGTDVSLSDLLEARRRLELHERLGAPGGPPKAGWALCAADGLYLPFPARRFDLVICCEVLEHLTVPSGAVAELARVLKPGGHLVVSVPRYWPERVCWALSREYAAAEGGHLRIYRRSEAIALLSAAGLKVQAIRHAHALHSPYWWLKCLLGLEHAEAWPVRLYLRFLTWDMMKKPRVTRFLERLLNLLLGKSLVAYCRKGLE
jgi:SAM-dependent methyltransferase